MSRSLRDRYLSMRVPSFHFPLPQTSSDDTARVTAEISLKLGVVGRLFFCFVCVVHHELLLLRGGRHGGLCVVRV